MKNRQAVEALEGSSARARIREHPLTKQKGTPVELSSRPRRGPFLLHRHIVVTYHSSCSFLFCSSPFWPVDHFVVLVLVSLTLSFPLALSPSSLRCFLFFHITQFVQRLASMATSTSSADRLVMVSTPSDGVRVIAFNRPAKRNAFSQQLIDDFLGVLSEASTDEAVRVIVVTGNGGVFSGMINVCPPPVVDAHVTRAQTWIHVHASMQAAAQISAAR